MAELRKSRDWVDGLCTMQTGIHEITLTPDMIVMCNDHARILRQSAKLSAIRRALHTHVGMVANTMDRVMGWLSLDPFFEFQGKMLVNTICTSFASFLPFVMLLLLIYVAMVLAGLIVNMRIWNFMRNGGAQQIQNVCMRSERGPYYMEEPTKSTPHNSMISDAELVGLQKRVMGNIVGSGGGRGLRAPKVV